MRSGISANRTRHAYCSSLLLLGLLLLTVACGRKDRPAEGLVAAPMESAATPLAYIAPGTTPVASSTRSALAEIRERGELRVGVLYNYPPFGELTDTGTVAGFEVDLARAMAAEWGVELAFVQVTRQTGIPYLLDGEIDMLAAAQPIRREMHELVDFSQTTFRSGYLLLVNNNAEVSVESLADLDGATVASSDDLAANVLMQQAVAAGVTVGTRRYDSNGSAVQDLLDDELAAVVGRRETLMLASAQYESLSIMDEFLLLEPYAFAVRRDDANFRNLIDATLQKLAVDGDYAVLFNQHFYNFPADFITAWPAAATLTFDSLPVSIAAPSDSAVKRLLRGEVIKVAGLNQDYSEPQLDGQRLLDDFNRALLNEMARRWDVSFDEVAGGEANRLVAEGQADMAVGVTPDRSFADGVDFSQSYLRRGLRLAHLSDVDLDGIDDLSSPRTSLVVNSLRGADLIRDSNTGATVIETNSAREALTALQSRGAWAVLADEFTIGLIARQGPNIDIKEQVYLPLDYAMSVPRFDSDLRALVNFTLQDMYADGTFDRLVQQYFGPYAPEGSPFEPLPIEIWPGSAAYLGLENR